MVVFVLVFLAVGAAQNWCMLNNPINRNCGVCTANDVSISNLALVGPPQACTIGQPITINIEVEWQSTANGRYSVAAYIARDGGNALTGSCSEFILSPVGSPVNSGTQASPSTGPFLDLNGDKCGDLNSGTVVWQSVSQINITCRDQDHNGVADVSGCTSWEQNQNANNCQSVADAPCGAPSKCRCDSILNIAGLSTCLQAQAPCVPATDSASNSCNGAVFAALVSVATTAASTSTVFAPSSITTGYIYSNFVASPGTSLAMDFFAPGTPISSPGPIVRRDLLNPCKVQRQVFCGGTSSCSSIAETQTIPRLFHELGDVPCAGTVCSGALYNPTQCAQGYAKPATIGTGIAFVWTLAGNVTPCAAQASDGTLYQFFSSTSGTAGVIDILPTSQPLLQPGNSVPFNFTASGACTFPQCAVDVELVFVIDEQIALSNSGFQNVLQFVASLIGTFNTASARTRFGVWFTYNSNSTSPPVILTQNTAPPNLVTNVILPHNQANSSSTDFVAAVTSAVNKYWPPGTPANGVAREIVTFVGGPDASGGNYASVSAVLSAANVQAWAIGVESGASQQAALAGLSTSGGTYQHWQGIYNTTNLPLSVGYEGQILCPQSNLCGVGCLGFCSCSSPGVNTCSCPACSQPSQCAVNSCSNPTVGCVSQAKVCNDNNACTSDSCSASTGCVYSFVGSTTCSSNQVCVNSTGCVNTTVPGSPGSACTGAGAGNCTQYPCFSQTCTNSKCVPAVMTVCNDNNGCTSDTCDVVKGCVYTLLSCQQSSSCFVTSCVNGTGSQPNCSTSATPVSCDDANSCTVDSCSQGIGCIHTNYSCPSSTIPCSFPNGCIGTSPTPQCLIANYSCGLSAAAIGGITGGVIAGIVVAAVVAALLAAFLSKQGYSYWMAKSANSASALQSSPAFKDNSNAGEMPQSDYQAF